MRFASIGGSSNFATAGNIAGAQAQRSFGVTRSQSPNMGELAQVGMEIRSQEKQANTKIEGQMRKLGIQEVGKHTVDRLGRETEEIKRGAKRKAGALALLGKMAPVAADLMSNEKTKRRNVGETSSKYDSVIAGLRNSAESLRGGMQNTDVDFKPLSIDTSSSTSNTGGTGTSSTATGGGTAGKTTGGSTLTGNQKVVADAIAKYESGDWGYEAFYQGGAAGGTKVVGKSGNYKNHFGKSLTDMTLGEIFKKQNTKQQGMSFQQHLDSGGLHAVGRYQFIGSTLQDEVSRLGLSHDTKFTPEVQDQIFLSHIKRVGNISPWVGPSNNYSASEKAQFKNMIAGF